MEKIREGMSAKKVAEILMHNFEYLDQKFADNINNYYDDLTQRLKDSEKRVTEMATNEVVLADNEDTAVVHGALKLADREYNPKNFSGKGFKILRKRLYAVGESDCPCDNNCCTCDDCQCNCCSNDTELSDPNRLVRNILLQRDFDQENTIYVVRYDFDLNTLAITLPEGSELRFEGGTLNNGIVDLNGCKVTGVLGNIYDYFNCDVRNFAVGQLTFKGTKQIDGGDMFYWDGFDWQMLADQHQITALRNQINNLAANTVTLDTVQTAINAGCGVDMAMPSANGGKISLPMKTLTLSQFNSITPVTGITYNIIGG